MAGIARLGEVVLDCPDPDALAAFYSRLTGWQVNHADEEWVALADPERPGPRLSFQRAPGYRPPVWPDPASSMQVHLDFRVEDLDEAERAAIAAGAAKHENQPMPERFRVMTDPVGHLFCLCLYQD